MKNSTRIMALVLGEWLLGAGAALAQDRAKEGLGLEFRGGARMAFEVPPQEGAKLLKEIAAARVALDVTGDLGSALRTLDDLTQRVFAAQGFEGQTEAIVQLALARAELHVRCGEVALARAVLTEARPQSILAHGEITMTEASTALDAAQEAAQSDSRLSARRKELDESAAKGPASQDRPLEELIEEAAAEGRWNAILAIGPIAFEHFAKQVLASAARFPLELDAEPLLPLLQLDERRAARFLAENFEAGGEPWKRRILGAMQVRRVLENPGTWTESRPHVCLEPEWLDLVLVLLGEPTTARDALPFFAEIERRDALTERLVAAFRRALLGFGPEFAVAGMQVFDHSGVVPSAQAALEAALELEDVRLRRFAADKLVHFERSEALLARANDPDLMVRWSVVKALSPRTVEYWIQNGSNRFVSLEPRLAERDRPTVEALLRDGDEGIREAAVARISDMERPTSASILEELLGDPSPTVRAALARLSTLAVETQATVLASLASDESPSVLRQVDEVLSLDFRAGGPISTQLTPFAGVLAQRRGDTRYPLDGRLQTLIDGRLIETAEGTRMLVDWTLGAPADEAWDWLSRNARTEHLMALPDEFLARLLASSPDLGRWSRLWAQLNGEVPTGRVPRPAAMRLLLADRNATRIVRLVAARWAVDGGTASQAVFLELLREDGWKTSSPSTAESEWLGRCAETMQPVARNALILAILRDDRIVPEVADGIAAGFSHDAPGGREIAQFVLDQWFRPGAPARKSVVSALYQLGTWPDLASTELLERALVVPDYSEAVVSAVADMANPVHLPLLARAMRPEWLPSSEWYDLQLSVAETLGSFHTDEAVAILLQGLRSSEVNLRMEFRDSLERIKHYRAEVAAWQSHEKPVPTKESAVADLLAMLADADALVRKEAARGLGVLGAIEALPDLIRALKDADPGVRAAAQASIDRLNRPSEPVDIRERNPKPAGG